MDLPGAGRLAGRECGGRAAALDDERRGRRGRGWGGGGAGEGARRMIGHIEFSGTVPQSDKATAV